LAGFDTYNQLRTAHRDWVNDSLEQGGSAYDSRWTRSIAVGSERFVHRTRKELGARAKGRVVLESEEGFQLRERGVSYLVDSGPKNDDIENRLLRPRIWPSSRASSGVEPCDVPFRYASDPTPCGCPVARPSSRSRHSNS
jgi:hypothetical protein